MKTIIICMSLLALPFVSESGFGLGCRFKIARAKCADFYQYKPLHDSDCRSETCDRNFCVANCTKKEGQCPTGEVLTLCQKVCKDMDLKSPVKQDQLVECLGGDTKSVQSLLDSAREDAANKEEEKRRKANAKAVRADYKDTVKSYEKGLKALKKAYTAYVKADQKVMKAMEKRDAAREDLVSKNEAANSAREAITKDAQMQKYLVPELDNIEKGILEFKINGEKNAYSLEGMEKMIPSASSV